MVFNLTYSHDGSLGRLGIQAFPKWSSTDMSVFLSNVFQSHKIHSFQFDMQKMFLDDHLQKSFKTGQDTCMLPNVRILSILIKRKSKIKMDVENMQREAVVFIYRAAGSVS